MLLKVAVQAHSSVQKFSELAAVEPELVKNVGFSVVGKVEIGIVENPAFRNPVAIRLVLVQVLR